MASSKWSLRAVFNRSLLPRKWISKTALLRSALDSGFRRNDGPPSEEPWLSLHVPIKWQLLLCGSVLLIMLAACSVVVPPEASTSTESVESETDLLATATAVAPAASQLRARLAQECEWYGECDGPSRWDAIVLALEQRPLRLPVLAPSDACPETPDRWVEGFRYELVGDGPVYGLALHMEVVRADESYFPAHDGWYWSKVVWARDLQYPGPFVIRGQQLNGPEIIRFEQLVPGGPLRPNAGACLFVAALPSVYHSRSSRYTGLSRVGRHRFIRGRAHAGLLWGADRWSRLQHSDRLCGAGARDE